jgi:hypothetical protein
VAYFPRPLPPPRVVHQYGSRFRHVSSCVCEVISCNCCRMLMQEVIVLFIYLKPELLKDVKSSFGKASMLVKYCVIACAFGEKHVRSPIKTKFTIQAALIAECVLVKTFIIKVFGSGGSGEQQETQELTFCTLKKSTYWRYSPKVLSK